MSKILIIIYSLGIIHEISACVDPPKIDCSIQPEKQVLDPIQQYHHSEFKLVSINTKSAVVSTPDGNIFKIVERSKIGRDFGIVVKIEENQIVINEMVSTGMENDCEGKGSWLVRPITIQTEKK